jgi:D-arabinose 1-dehydrogenase-like Zn-dependent alcohol dehydrogenase
MKTRAAVLRKGGEPWEITELDLDEPKAGEVLIRYEAAGLCHSDAAISMVVRVFGEWSSASASPPARRRAPTAWCPRT